MRNAGGRNPLINDPNYGSLAVIEQTNSQGGMKERYSQRSNPEFEAVMALRTATKEGAFFLRCLRPGMRVLDVGCGPGSITRGFAEAVAPGEVVGIDFQASQVNQAEASRESHSLTNLRFEVADAYQLPFPDQTFDAVFANAVLWHLREPDRVLAEIRRVLCPGGIVGIRDCDWGGRICSPSIPLLEKWWPLTVQIRQHNGGNPFLGRNLRRLLLEAGFQGVEMSASSWTAGTPEQVRNCATFLKAQLNGFASTALEERLIDKANLIAIADAIDTWSGCRDAFYMDTYCEVLGFR
jgi:ubiquinone/menaquinone biosynthesis C-methylase UbiE